MGVFPAVARDRFAVELDTEAVGDTRFLRARDDDVTDFFFKTFSHAQLHLVMNPQHEDEVSRPRVIPVVAVLCLQLLERRRDPFLADDCACGLDHEVER
jgi:hypothetical protein